MQWLPGVGRDTIKADFLAGLTGAIVVLPQGVAFAAIAGMPLEYGLYTAMVPAIVAAFFGSSWHLVSGPTTAASIVLLSVLSVHAAPGSEEFVRLALTLTFLVGLIQMAMGAARLGTLVNFISHSVIIGFTAGAAILIASSQLKHFLGMDIPRGLHPHEILLHIGQHAVEINFWVVAVSVTTLLSGLFFKRYVKKVPYMIAAMLIGSLVAFVLNRIYGQDVTGIVTIGALPASLPPLSTPDFSLQALKELLPGAIAVTLLALTEAVSIARSIGVRSGQHVDGNQEFIGQGLSNVVGSFFSAYVATGSFNRSGVNYEAGARTPLAAAFAGIMLIGVVVLVAPYASYLPNAAMAGILILVAWGLIDFHHIGIILKTSRSEAAVLGVTFFSTLLMDLEFAIMVGVVASLVTYLYRTSRPRVLARVPDPSLPDRKFNTDPALPECPQLKIVRIDGSLFFGAVNHVRETLRDYAEREPRQKHLLIVASGMNFVDVAGAEYLAQESRTRRAAGGGVYFYRIKPGACDALTRGGFRDEIGTANMYQSKTDALHDIVVNKLDPQVCRHCARRIFLECKDKPGPDEPLIR
ncbi:sodium-independent anion transporter [Acidihalobacter ferrooxydans]|uniref:Sodium-independent anion transporter n=2 Tax=Acidihalobacter ferrooxydans TaxID=1765967 RepID=A0A1P8UKX1_9GAMM|nr:SulP family inorganic anion transporter [Acidihalobacter ferrooxydans]APZ44455.1 sodium-independent anion transporter [Acidihalobacter ferrooxydans]